ncbi:MAG: CARDB domain-containing protein [Promethearchaeota archaeon]
MNKKQIVVVSLVFVLGLALVPSSMGMMRTINDSQPVFVDILGSNRITDDMENLDVENTSESSSFASNNVSSEKITFQKTKILEEVNKTYIRDPTGKTEGYFREDFSEDFFELMGSRGQTSRHFYNKITGIYRYQSDNLVQKEGVYEETVWVTAEEYPHRFILRLRNGEIFFFETALEISEYLNTIDRTSIWAVGFESFAGVLGFYLNFQDTVNGHGQYLYWPRLSSGKISAYNMPLYAIYPHLFAKYNDIWYDQILNDKSLYSGIAQNPCNTLEFYNSESEFGVFFTLLDVIIQGTTWNFKHGFKYRTDDQLFHMITEFECVDQDLEDIGLAYEITSTPQGENTSFRPEKFVLRNETMSVAVSAQEVWKADQYFEDFYSQIDIISENREQFIFSFYDMNLAGFTERYLELHEQQMPDGTIKKMLCAGMYGLGDYSAGTWIKIDPDSTGTRYTIDNYDLYRDSFLPVTSSTTFRVGIKSGNIQTLFIAFDTDLNVPITDTSAVAFQMYCTSSSFDSSTEGADCTVYNIGGNGNTNTAREDSTSYSLGTNSEADKVYSGNIGSGGYKTASASKMESLTDYWASNRGDNEGYISFLLDHDGAENGDYYTFRESSYSGSGTTYDPKISFSYVTESQTAEISGDVKESGTNDPIQGASVELYYDGSLLNSTSTNSQGYYSFSVDESDNLCDLWVWHQDYVKQSEDVTPNEDQEVDFFLNPEIPPMPNPPYGYKNPTSFSDPISAWSSETEAYTKGGDYAIGHTSGYSVFYKNFAWDVPSDVTIQGVMVYVHWKPVFDDKIRVKLAWNNWSSAWKSVTAFQGDWDEDWIDFSDATEWNSTIVNSNNFRVVIRKMTQGSSADKVLIDWVGTLVKYVDLNITAASVPNNPEKGDEVEFSITIENLGTTLAGNVDARIKIEGDSYDWSGYICGYRDWDVNLPAGATETHSITIDAIFNHNGNYYAWNVGDYRVVQVDATCNQDSTNSYITEVPFDVDGASSGAKKIFAVVYYDTEFTDLSWVSSVSSFFYGAVSHDIKVHDDSDELIATYNDGFEELMNVEYVGLFRSGWDPASNLDLEEMFDDVRNYAETDLGLDKPWKKIGDTGTLTSSENHGFDVLGGLSGTGTQGTGGYGTKTGSCFVVQGVEEDNNDYGGLVLVHELSHHFGASDHHPPEWDILIDCVMKDGEFNVEYPTYYVHWDGSVDQMGWSFMG